jgi:hypothetical protein
MTVLRLASVAAVGVQARSLFVQKKKDEPKDFGEGN